MALDVTQRTPSELIEKLRGYVRSSELTHTERYDEQADRFQRETGFIAPGRSVPPAVGGGAFTDPDTRSEAWNEWQRLEREDWKRVMEDVIAALSPSASPLSARWQELFWALPSGPMRSKLRALEIDVSRALRLSPSAREALGSNADPLRPDGEIKELLPADQLTVLSTRQQQKDEDRERLSAMPRSESYSSDRATAGEPEFRARD